MNAFRCTDKIIVSFPFPSSQFRNVEQSEHIGPFLLQTPMRRRGNCDLCGICERNSSWRTKSEWINYTILIVWHIAYPLACSYSTHMKIQAKTERNIYAINLFSALCINLISTLCHSFAWSLNTAMLFSFFLNVSFIHRRLSMDISIHSNVHGIDLTAVGFVASTCNRETKRFAAHMVVESRWPRETK